MPRKLKSKHINRVIDCEKSLNSTYNDRCYNDRIKTLVYMNHNFKTKGLLCYGNSIFFDKDHLKASEKIVKDMLKLQNFIVRNMSYGKERIKNDIDNNKSLKKIFTKVFKIL